MRTLMVRTTAESYQKRDEVGKAANIHPAK